MTLTTDTLYPFRDTVEYTVSAAAPVEKTLHFRIPGWCKAASLYINGKTVNTAVKPGTFADLPGTWRDGDKITLCFPMEVRISQVDDSDRSSHYPIVVEYGPLLFALPVPERWDAYPGEPYGDHGRVFVTDRLELSPVPFDCTNLRISYFPRAEEEQSTLS